MDRSKTNNVSLARVVPAMLPGIELRLRLGESQVERCFKLRPVDAAGYFLKFQPSRNL